MQHTSVRTTMAAREGPKRAEEVTFAALTSIFSIAGHSFKGHNQVGLSLLRDDHVQMHRGSYYKLNSCVSILFVNAK